MTSPPETRRLEVSDGVELAYMTMGSGPLLIYLPDLPFSNFEQELQGRRMRAWYDILATGRRLVRYDGRGSGNSTRNVQDVSLEAQVRDLDALISHLGSEPVDLFAPTHAGPIALSYAARSPHKVSSLVLWCTYSRGTDAKWVGGIGGVIGRDWETYTETVAHALLGWSHGEAARRYAQFIRQSVTSQDLRAMWAAIRAADASSTVPEMTARALVLHRREFSFVPATIATALAEHLPNGTLTLLDGASPAPQLGDEVAEAVLDFLDPGMGARTAAETPGTSDVTTGIQTIMFTDLESSTALTQKVGDEAAQEVLHGHNDAVRKSLADNGGREVKHTGDGIMAAFPSAVRAVEAALQIQRDLEGGEVRVRIGLNAGEPIAEDGDFFGTAVQLAARVCDRADPGQVLVSRVVADLCAGKQLKFNHHSDATLKGFDEPVALYMVGS